jgi:divalent metal cation (Fe/Co/Zn/Cd) transporter
MKNDDRTTWTQHSLNLAVFTSVFHILQFSAGLLLWTRTSSPSLISYALDALVSAFASAILAVRIQRSHRADVRGQQEKGRHRLVAFGYMAAGTAALVFGVVALWSGSRPARTILGIVLAAVSMLVIPIIGSYMKVLAVELRSQALKSAAIFTFGNSYLSMVLLIAMLMNAGMDLGWGDPAGALVMFPFMAQKGIQILLEEGEHEYVEE